MAFILAEDAALKARLQDIYVADEKNPQRKVGVWFGQPDLEIRDQAYPYITIDLFDINEAIERAHRGYVELQYRPDSIPMVNPNHALRVDFPIPVNLDYQVTTYCRQPRHDRQLLSELLTTRLPMRFGHLPIPGEDTVRRLDLLGYAKRDTVENAKRLFVNIFSVRVSSELYIGQILELGAEVTTVNISAQQIVEQFNTQAGPPSPTNNN